VAKRCEELKVIEENAGAGGGSEFVKELGAHYEEVLSGKLNRKIEAKK
jgi:hypothetical protein